MGTLTLITGGCRSGKSGFAQNLAEQHEGPRVFVATCDPWDDEMRERVRRHQQERAGRGWRTLDAPLAVTEAVQSQQTGVVLVDCLTLWLGNLMHRAECDKSGFSEDAAAEYARALVASCRSTPAEVILVTNEVGWGIVPENALARRFRDCAGRINRVVAEAADQVTLVCCGLPLDLKKGMP